MAFTGARGFVFVIAAAILGAFSLCTTAFASPTRTLKCENSDGSLRMIHAPQSATAQTWYLEGHELPQAHGIFSSNKQVLSSEKSFNRSQTVYRVRVFLKSVNLRPLFIDIHEKTSRVYNAIDVMTCTEINTLG